MQNRGMKIEFVFNLHHTIFSGIVSCMSNNEIEIKLKITIVDAFWIVVLTIIQTGAYIVWRFFSGTEIDIIGTSSGTIVPLFTLFSTFIVEIKGGIMFLAAHLKRKFYYRGKAEGIAESKSDMVAREAEWIEWAENGRDPDKMPSKVNPVNLGFQKNSLAQSLGTLDLEKKHGTEITIAKLLYTALKANSEFSIDELARIIAETSQELKAIGSATISKWAEKYNW